MSTITVLMGATYLIYSSYYISLNIPNMQFSLSISLNILHLIMFVVVVLNILKVRSFLSHQRRIIYDSFLDQLKAAVNLKVTITNQFLYFAVTYFTFEFVIHGLIPVDLPLLNQTKDVIQ